MLEPGFFNGAGGAVFIREKANVGGVGTKCERSADQVGPLGRVADRGYLDTQHSTLSVVPDDSSIATRGELDSSGLDDVSTDFDVLFDAGTRDEVDLSSTTGLEHVGRATVPEIA